MSILKILGVREQKNFNTKYEFLEFLSNVLEMSSACTMGEKEDLYSELAMLPDTQCMLFGWCIIIENNVDTFNFNEKYVPLYFDVFARMYAHAPDLYQRYINNKTNHPNWVIRNLMFSEHIGRPHLATREACCRFYDRVLARPRDRDLFIGQLPEISFLKSKVSDVLWVLLRFFGEGAPALPDSVYATISTEKRVLKYLLPHLSPGKADVNDALRVTSSLVAKVPLSAPQAEKMAGLFLDLFFHCTRRKAVTSMQTEDVDEAALCKAWEGFLARNKENSSSILHALRLFIGPQQQIARISRDFIYGIQGFAESVHKLLDELKGEDESLVVALILAVVCDDGFCSEIIKRGKVCLPKLTRDEIAGLYKKLLHRNANDCKALCQKMSYCLGVYGKILYANVKNNASLLFLCYFFY